jgi:hypothetical protein
MKSEPGREIAFSAAIAKARSTFDLLLSGFSSENTRRAYAREIESFAAFAGHKTLPGLLPGSLLSKIGKPTLW